MSLIVFRSRVTNLIVKQFDKDVGLVYCGKVNDRVIKYLDIKVYKLNCPHKTYKYFTSLEHFNKLNEFALLSGGEKMRLLNLYFYGVENVYQSSDIKNKIKETNLKKYGVEHPSQRPEIKQKIKETCLSKYGVTTNLQINEVRSKVKENNFKKYGDTCYFKSKTHREFTRENAKNPNTIKNIVKSRQKRQSAFEKDNDCIKVTTLIKQYGQGWLSIYDNITILENKGTHFVPKHELNKIINYHHKYTNISKFEYSVRQFLTSKNIEYSTNVRFYKKGKSYIELDIFIPSLNIGIECNGNYWHSSIFCKKDYHINKTIFFENKGIKLLHINEFDWYNNQEKEKEIINKFINSVVFFDHELVLNRATDNYLDYLPYYDVVETGQPRPFYIDCKEKKKYLIKPVDHSNRLLEIYDCGTIKLKRKETKE